MKIDNKPFGVQDPNLESFRESVSNAWNYGKYPFPILTSGTPTWKAQPGEAVLYRPSSGGMSLFTYVQASAWLVLVSAST